MLKNTNSAYGWVAIFLHWVMALVVFGMFGLGLYMVDLTYYDAWYKGSLNLHKSIGISLAMVWLVRVIWRQLNTWPEPLGDKHLEQKAAHWVHIVLYILMLALFTSGYLISTADGRAISVFNFISIPATLTADNQEDVAGLIHEVLAWSLIVLVALHAFAAIKHHFINRDQTLLRMLKPKQDIT